MPSFAPVSEYDYYYVCKELGIKEPEAWARSVPYAQVVKWVVFFRLHNRRQEGPGE